MQFKASLSRASIILTVVLIIFISIIAFVISSITYSVHDLPLWPIAAVLLPVLSLFITWGFHVRGYEISNDHLVIRRPFSPKYFPLNTIQNVQKITRRDLRFSFRMFGNGGFFGYFGNFWNKNFGNMTWYATNLDNAVLITLNDKKKILVTPNAYEDFINVVTKNKL